MARILIIFDYVTDCGPLFIHFSGEAFRIREFHRKILEIGPVSLKRLEKYLLHWIGPVHSGAHKNYSTLYYIMFVTSYVFLQKVVKGISRGLNG